MLRIALSAGEPAGIGPDLLVQLAQQSFPAELVAFADPSLLRQRARQLGLPLRLHPVDWNAPATPAPSGTLVYAPNLTLSAAALTGTLDAGNSAYVLACLSAACDACDMGHCAALVTGPVHKGIINTAGFPFTGHTEWLADRYASHPVMMLACPDLRVALLTTHLPLRKVPDAVTEPLLRLTIDILHGSLQQFFGFRQPRIAVAGLNPHAGEQGYLGREEVDIIAPTLETLRAQGMLLSGPHPADTLFLAEKMSQYDAVLVMYHDQGLPVLKHHGFDQAVNISLGLPIIRTSVDHGTALELAGTGRAEVASFIAAIQTAIDMAERHHP